MSQAWARTGRRWQAHGRGVGGWVSCPEPPRSGWAAPRRMETGGRRRRCFDVLLYRFCQKSSRNKNKQTNEPSPRAIFQESSSYPPHAGHKIENVPLGVSVIYLPGQMASPQVRCLTLGWHPSQYPRTCQMPRLQSAPV